MPASGRIEELRRRYDENPRRFFAPLANEYRKLGDLPQAIDLCRMHLAEGPANLNGQIVFGQALYDSANLDEARGAFEAAIALDPENLIALRHLGDIARELGDIPTARSWYQRVLDADRRNEEVLAIMDELAAVEAAGLSPASLTPPSTPAAETIELEEPPMHAPAPARPSIHSLIGAPPPAISQEALAVSSSDAGSIDEVQLEEVPVEPIQIDEVHVEEVRLTAREDAPASEIQLDAPSVQEIHLEDAPEIDAPPSDADALDFGMVSPVEHVTEDPPAAAPDSSFGFDIDLGAAADLPVSNAPDQLPDGNIDLHEPLDIDSFGMVQEVETSEPEPDLLSPPPKLELVRSDDIEDSFDIPDHDIARSITPERPIALVPDEPTPSSDEGGAPGQVTPLSFDHDAPLDLHHEEPLNLSDDTILTSEESLAIDAQLSIEDAAPAPVAQIQPRRTTPVVFNFDLSVDDPATQNAASAGTVEAMPPDGPDQTGVALPDSSIALDAPELAADEIDAESATPVEAFATETMAELYVKQGLRHEAIGVYKQLLDARPHDESLRRRLAELEDDGLVPQGASARDFFAAISRRTSRGRTPRANPVLPNAAPPRGTLDRLFGDASVARSDESAAQSLSAAFGPESPATEESALDRVFKVRPPGQ